MFFRLNASAAFCRHKREQKKAGDTGLQVSSRYNNPEGICTVEGEQLNSQPLQGEKKARSMYAKMTKSLGTGKEDNLGKK